MQIEEYLEKIKNTSSKNEKIKLLKQANKKTQLFFYLTYNPLLTTNIKKITKPKSLQNRSISESIKEFATLYMDLYQRKYTGNAAKEQVNQFLSSVSSIAAEWYIRSLKKDLKSGYSATLLNEAFHKRFIPLFEIQLANKYNTFIKTKKGKATQYYFASPKLDGIRAVFITRKSFDTVKDAGDRLFPLDYYNGDGLYTRQGKKIIGFEFIEESIAQHKTPNIEIIDGELYSYTIPFAEIQGAVTSFKNIDPERKKQIFFNVFAVKTFTPVNTEEMINLYQSTFKNAEYIKTVEQIKITKDDVIEMHGKYISNGYEGIMLRNVDVSWECGRTNNLLKYKDFIEEDFVITGFEYGKKGTRFEDILNVLWVQGKYNGIDIKSKVYGMSDSLKNELDELRKKEQLYGTVVEVKFQEYTPDGSLRFASVNKIKLDR